MCIAAYVPATIEISEEILKECFRSNPDGAGIMYTDGEMVYISKGYMDSASFVKAFMEIPVHFDRSFHCRIATSGKIEEGCCHPFPIMEDMKDMKKTKHVCTGAVAHNGIISWATPTKGKAEWYSDTMNFISLILAPLQEKIHEVALHDLIERSTTGNKFIIMTPAKVHLIGTFVQEGGIFYSNSSFRPIVRTGYYESDCWETGTRRGYYANQGTGSKYARKNSAVSKIKNPALTEAYWIMINSSEANALSKLANSLTIMGINVIEEDEALMDSKNCYLFLVDALPKYTVNGCEWSLIGRKVD